MNSTYDDHSIHPPGIDLPELVRLTHARMKPGQQAALEHAGLFYFSY